MAVAKIGLATLLGAVLAAANVHRAAHVATPASIESFAGESRVTITGTIADEPDRRPLQTKYTIAAAQLETASGEVVPVNGRMLASDHSGYPQYRYGDRVKISGKLERPGEIDGFRYDHYLSRFGIYSVMYRASVELIEPGPPSPFRWLYDLKTRFEAQINRLYAEPQASFMAGLLTGSRRGIPDHVLEDFHATGLTHIIAISGYNITIIITVISSLLFWLPLRWRLAPAAAAILVFTIFVGASAAVVRAAIMGLLGLLALHAGRLSHARLTLLWAAALMVAWNPKYLWYDAGFQLSFAAVVGLVELSPWLEKWFAKVPKFFGLREALQLTVAAQISTAPLLWLLFGRVSMVAPLTNALVAPAIPLAMLFGFAGTVLSFAWFFGGQVLAYPGWACLQWILLVAKYGSW